MAKVNVDLKKDTTRAPMKTGPGLDYGTAPLKANVALGNTLQQVSHQVGAMAQDYALKNKRSDMKADELKYESEKLKMFQEADAAASQLTAKEDIDRVYDNAQAQLDKYATGKNSAGIPNIRWKDQQGAIMGDAEISRVRMEGHKTKRKLEVTARNTQAIYKSNMIDAIQGMRLDLIRENTNMMVPNGYFTQEESDLAYKEAAIESELMNAQAAVDATAAMSVEDARLADQAFRDDVNNGGRYEELSKAQLEDIKRQSRDAVLTAQRKESYGRSKDVKAAQQTQLHTSKNLLGAFARKDTDFDTALAELSKLRPVDPTTGEPTDSLEWQIKANAIMTGKDKYNTMADPNAAIMRRTQDWNDWHNRVLEYSETQDKDGMQLADLMAEAYSMGEYGMRAIDLLQRRVAGIEHTMTTGEMAMVEKRAYGILDKYFAQHGPKNKKRGEGFVDEHTVKVGGQDVKVSDMDVHIWGLVNEVISKHKMSGPEAIAYIENDYMLSQLQSETDLVAFRDNFLSIRTGGY